MRKRAAALALLPALAAADPNLLGQGRLFTDAAERAALDSPDVPSAGLPGAAEPASPGAAGRAWRLRGILRRDDGSEWTWREAERDGALSLHRRERPGVAGDPGTASIAVETRAGRVVRLRPGDRMDGQGRARRFAPWAGRP